MLYEERSRLDYCNALGQEKIFLMSERNILYI